MACNYHTLCYDSIQTRTKNIYSKRKSIITIKNRLKNYFNKIRVIAREREDKYKLLLQIDKKLIYVKELLEDIQNSTSKKFKYEDTLYDRKTLVPKLFKNEDELMGHKRTLEKVIRNIDKKITNKQKDIDNWTKSLKDAENSLQRVKQQAQPINEQSRRIEIALAKTLAKR